jgi:SAM-dependent methyltransferase
MEPQRVCHSQVPAEREGPYTVAMDKHELLQRFYPESNVSGFSHVDGTVAFFTQIASVLSPTDVVLDFGAGRGEHIVDDENRFRRDLSNLKGRCAHVEGCDVDDVVLQNCFLDHAEVITPDVALPYPDDRFDIVVSRYVFEHIDNPDQVARELLRVVKPGGLIAAVTPNKYGYIAIGASLLPNRMHVKVLNRIQPWRKAEDVFPTRYRMNTPAALRKVFGSGAYVNVAYWSPEPAYHMGSPVVYSTIKWMNKHLPATFQPTLHVYIRKR